MKDYHIVFGAYSACMRTAPCRPKTTKRPANSPSKNSRAAAPKCRGWTPNYDNLALPSIVSMQIVTHPATSSKD